jgi:hypothetical protein
MTEGAFRLVMAAPVAAIHALKNLHACKTRIPYTRPGMTIERGEQTKRAAREPPFLKDMSEGD